MNGEDREILKQIYSHCSRISIVEKDVNEIKEKVNKPIFDRVMIDAELHQGDQESLMKILGNTYGFTKKFSGWDILSKILEKFAIETERKNSFINSILHATSFKVIEFICIVSLLLFVTIQYLAGK